MRQASVGYHCPDCVKSSSQKVYHGIGASVSAPYAVGTLLAAIIGVYLLHYFGDASENPPSYALRSSWWLVGTKVENGEWWRVISSGFAHANIVHLGMNGYALWVFGKELEERFGKVALSLFFFGGLFGGSLAVVQFNFFAPTLGASGAILGLIGALSVALYDRGVNIFQTPLGGIALLNLGLPLLVTQISFWGHMGGFLGGALAAWVLLIASKKVSENLYVSWGLTALTCLTLAGASYAVVEAGLYQQ